MMIIDDYYDSKKDKTIPIGAKRASDTNYLCKMKFTLKRTR